MPVFIDSHSLCHKEYSSVQIIFPNTFFKDLKGSGKIYSKELKKKIDESSDMAFKNGLFTLSKWEVSKACGGWVA
jgi:hypothetical protein